MKSFIRKLFNRTILVLLILVIEIVALIAVIFIAQQFGDPNSYLGSKYPDLMWIGVIDDILIVLLLLLQVAMLFRVLYRQMDSEFKIPWILILILLPLIGSLLYIVFGRRNLKKKEAALLKNSDYLGEKYFELESKLPVTAPILIYLKPNLP